MSQWNKTFRGFLFKSREQRLGGGGTLPLSSPFSNNSDQRCGFFGSKGFIAPKTIEKWGFVRLKWEGLPAGFSVMTKVGRIEPT